MSRPKIKELDKLWADCIKARAGHKSEYSGKTEKLNAHHIHGKSNYRMRWELDNGVSITSGEHFFIAHIQGRSQKFKEWAMKLRKFGEIKAKRLSTQLGGTDLFGVKLFLQQELKKYDKAY